ncbi:MAG: glycyl-radical enzyme activating protein [Clostridiales bacterium]|nr:glycyl-radical enzyme activating protein [Clostridiales bacterium]
MKTAFIFDVKHYAVHDGPGIRTTFFFQGCALRCLWCQNPESLLRNAHVVVDAEKCISCGACAAVCPAERPDGQRLKGNCLRCFSCAAACPTGALRLCGREVTVGDLLKTVRMEQPFYETSGGGITTSGGECLLQADFLEDFLRGCREIGVHTAVDTCGAVPFHAFERVLPYTDLFLYDLKLMDDALHRQCTGASNARILENLARLLDLGAHVRIRVPLIPGITDAPENIEAIGEWLLANGGSRQIDLLQYNSLAESKYEKPPFYVDEPPNSYPLPGLRPQSAEAIRALEQLLKRQGHAVRSLVWSVGS